MTAICVLSVKVYGDSRRPTGGDGQVLALPGDDSYSHSISQDFDGLEHVDDVIRGRHS